MKNVIYRMIQTTLVGTFVLAPISYAQDTVPTMHVIPGIEYKVKGVIFDLDEDMFTLKDSVGRHIPVTLNGYPEVKEKKRNPFRGAKIYSTRHLLRGLKVDVEGRGDGYGNLVAQEIKFTQSDYQMAFFVESRVAPVEGRLTKTTARLTQTEQNAERLSGQIEELNAISNAARGGAKAAQETADEALAQIRTANEKFTAADEIINERITALDEFEVMKDLTINFKAGRANLSEEARAMLQTIAEEAKIERGYVIEVTGFASSDGNEAFNRTLSKRRADAVVRFLVENDLVPLRRIIAPFGYGEKQPVADNKTREGRQKNRRVQIRILVNRGMVYPVKAASTSVGQ